MKQILDPQLMVAFILALSNPPLLPSLPHSFPLPLPSLPLSFFPPLFFLKRNTTHVVLFPLSSFNGVTMYSIKILTEKAYGRTGKFHKLQSQTW